ncbi:MAG TPA: hypothetical protein VJA26_03795, partial [Gammaproteobacteria bacterium]|nr:hypothetical protein [Gammaproteobacteria bacterium]
MAASAGVLLISQRSPPRIGTSGFGAPIVDLIRTWLIENSWAEHDLVHFRLDAPYKKLIPLDSLAKAFLVQFRLGRAEADL